MLKLMNFTILIIVVSCISIACDSGCPEGTHEYQHDCIPDSSANTTPGGYLPGGTTPPSYPDIEDIKAADMKVNDLPVDDSSNVETAENLNGFEVEEGTAGTILWVEGPENGIVYLDKMTDPDGNIVYDYTTDVQNQTINDRDFKFHYLPDASMSLFIPNTPSIDLTPGKWGLSIKSTRAGSDLSMKIATRKIMQDGYTKAKLNLNVWFVGGNDLTADNALSNSNYKMAVSIMKALYKTADVEIGEIKLHDVTTEEKKIYKYIDSMEEYGNLLTITERADNDWPNIFMVSSFGGSDMKYVLGMAAHIPGPPGIQGTKYSGVVVAADGLKYYERIIGLVMAHELAHWLGLFHTTESTGTYFDSIDDTLECPLEHDADLSEYVDSEECSVHGAKNVMFWQTPFKENFPIGGDKGQKFSYQQKNVLFKNPVMKYIP